LAGSVVALTGGAAFTGGVEAEKKKYFCHCGEPGSTCTTQHVSRRQRNAHLRDHPCDYRGACRPNITACAAAPITYNSEYFERSCFHNKRCLNFRRSNEGLECVQGRCQPIDLGKSCTNNGQCSTGRCEDNKCVNCPKSSTCGISVRECCSPQATCGLVGLVPRCLL
jgi:hypothetical protein